MLRPARRLRAGGCCAKCSSGAIRLVGLICNAAGPYRYVAVDSRPHCAKITKHEQQRVPGDMPGTFYSSNAALICFVSRLGGAPNMRAYSRLNCDALS